MRCAALILLLLGLAGCQAEVTPAETANVQKSAEQLQPNILLILADDLGYSDIGAYGGEIATPNLNLLAQQGVQYTNFYSAPTCGPTRGMLMTGIDAHRVGTGANAAALQRLPMLQGRPGYEGFLNQQVATLPERLAALNYQTFMAGKWDLGSQQVARPAQRGFDRSFALMESGASHFADMRGNFPFEPQVQYFEDDQLVEQLEEPFYSTRHFTDRLRAYLGEADTDRPWFAYAAYTAPHWPLQVPEGTPLPDGYDRGWKAVAQQRLQRLQTLGLLADGDLPEARISADWQAIEGTDRAMEIKRMQLYAAMVELLDQQIGRLIDAAQQHSRARPLVIVFLSDNGPEGNNIAGIGATGDWVAREFDLSLEAMGNPGSYAWTGQQWAEVSAQPFRLFKSFVSEGGIRVPAIFHGVGASGQSRQLASVMDILPTLLELAGGNAGAAEFDDKLELQGVSLLDNLFAPHVLIQRPALGFELYGNRAIVDNRYKASLIWPPAGTGEWQLFDLWVDPAESNDLAAQRPDLLQSLVAQWHRYAEDNGVYLFDHDNGYGRYSEYAQ